MRTGKARAGLSARLACHKRRNACGNRLPFGPEVGAVCGKAARTDLCGGRSAMSVPTATNHHRGIVAYSVPKYTQPRPVIVPWSTLYRARLGA
jgi:hypothetical protein